MRKNFQVKKTADKSQPKCVIFPIRYEVPT